MPYFFNDSLDTSKEQLSEKSLIDKRFTENPIEKQETIVENQTVKPLNILESIIEEQEKANDPILKNSEHTITFAEQKSLSFYQIS